jgi:hypothetical protein
MLPARYVIVVTHIQIDMQEEVVKRFFLSLPFDSHGTVVELNDQVLACVMSPPAGQLCNF